MDDVSLAAELVREAGMLAQDMLSAGLKTEYKTSVSDVVSAADHAAEELVTDRLAESRPSDGLVGEEGARKAGEGRTWYIDPVDDSSASSVDATTRFSNVKAPGGGAGSTVICTVS